MPFIFGYNPIGMVDFVGVKEGGPILAVPCDVEQLIGPVLTKRKTHMASLESEEERGTTKRNEEDGM